MSTAIKEWTKEDILELLDASDQAVCRAVVRVYKNQTHDERQAGLTKHHNGIGFSAFDAEILSSFARQIVRHSSEHSQYPDPLSPKQMAIARKRIKHYHRQLLVIANQGE
jgi:hypothetical protein